MVVRPFNNYHGRLEFTEKNSNSPACHRQANFLKKVKKRNSGWDRM